jgi:hypothetical protein
VGTATWDNSLRALRTRLHVTWQEGRFVKCLEYVASDEVWSCSDRRELSFWNCRDAVVTGTLLLQGKRTHCLCVVPIHGRATAWIGCDDEILVLDVKERRRLRIVALARVGEVVAITRVGPNVAWCAVRHRDNKGSIIAIDWSASEL